MYFSIKPLGGLFAAACILGSAQFFVLPAAAASAETAELGTPKILSDADATRYRQIFAYQEKRDWRRADRLIKKLTDKRLMGRVLYQRYMHRTGWRSSYKQLAGWMKEYADQPGAVRVWKLAVHRKPHNYRAPKRPIGPKASIYDQPSRAKAYKSTKRLSRTQRRERAHLNSDIRRHLIRGQGSRAAQHLGDKKFRKLFDTVELDSIRGRIAAVLFRYGNTKQAFELASVAANRSRKHGAYADWIAGMAAF